MATIIQNMACFEVEINAQNQRIYFDEDILRGKKINQIFFYSTIGYAGVTSPFQSPEFPRQNPTDFSFVAERFGAYFNLIESSGKTFCENLFVDNVKTSEFNSRNSPFVEIDVQRILDTKKSFLSVYLKNPFSNPLRALLFVSYQHRPVRMKDAVITGSNSAQFPTAGFEGQQDIFIQDFKLSDYFDKTLQDRRIKKIIVTGTIDYLYLKTKNGLIENIPCDFFRIRGVKEFYLDNLNIDFEKSFAYRRSWGVSAMNHDSSITLMY